MFDTLLRQEISMFHCFFLVFCEDLMVSARVLIKLNFNLYAGASCFTSFTSSVLSDEPIWAFRICSSKCASQQCYKLWRKGHSQTRTLWSHKIGWFPTNYSFCCFYQKNHTVGLYKHHLCWANTKTKISHLENPLVSLRDSEAVTYLRGRLRSINNVCLALHILRNIEWSHFYILLLVTSCYCQSPCFLAWQLFIKDQLLVNIPHPWCIWWSPVFGFPPQVSLRMISLLRNPNSWKNSPKCGKFKL